MIPHHFRDISDLVIFGPLWAPKGGGLKNSQNLDFLENGRELGKSNFTIKYSDLLRFFMSRDFFDDSRHFRDFLIFRDFWPWGPRFFEVRGGGGLKIHKKLIFPKISKFFEK